MFKRIALLLSIIIAFSAFTPSFAEDELSKAEEKLKILVSLGVADEKDSEKISQFNYISKAEFIGYICSMMGFGEIAEGSLEEMFAFAHNMGIIRSATENNDGQLRYDEALTMLVRAAGYDYHANQCGGFPTGYILMADKLDITEDMSGSSDRYLKVHEAVTLLYNMIDAGIADFDSISEEGVTYSGEIKDTVFGAYRNIYKVKGIVEATGTSSLYNNVLSKPGYVIISGKQYEGYISDDLLGHSVTAITERNDDVVSVLGVVDGDNKVLVIDGDDIDGVSADFENIEYIDDNDKEKIAKVSVIAKVIYNGLPLADDPVNYSNPDDGMLTLIDNNNDGLYDVVNIKNYETVVVNDVSVYAEKIGNIYKYDSALSSLDLRIDGDEDFVEIIKDGEECSIYDLQSKDVLSVLKAQSGNRKRIEIEVSRKVVSGAASKMATVNGETILTIDGNEYALSEGYKKANAAGDSEAREISLGTEYNFYLNSRGEIAYVNYPVSGLQYAIVKAIASDTGIETTYRIKLFTSSGDWNTYTLKDKLIYNGERRSAAYAEQNLSQMISLGSEITVIGYELDAEGKICKIEAAVENGTDEERLNSKTNFSSTYRPHNNSLAPQLFIGNNPIVWRVVTSDMANDSAYSVTNVNSAFREGWGNTVSAYGVDDYGFIKILVVFYSDTHMRLLNEESNLFIVRDIGKSLMEDGTVKYQLTGAITNYPNISCYTEKEELISGLKPGDVVSLGFDANNNLLAVDKCHSFADDGLPYKMESDLWVNSAILKGRVKKYDPERKFVDIDCGTGSWIVRTTAGPSVLIYDMESGQVEKGSLSDLTEDSYIITKINYYKMKSIVIVQ